MDDPENPAVWFLLFLKAVVGLQNGSTAATVEYLRFTERHRGRPVAVRAQAQIKRAAKSRAFENAQARLIKLQNILFITTETVA